jgi:mono/diheme cytochrome c family protein/5-hydroxyisourate hydrolase-like protein (transthyretin family)
MKTFFIQLAFSCFVLTIGCQDKSASHNPTTEESKPQSVSKPLISIDLVALKPEQLGKVQVTKVNDQVFKTVKTYRTYDFKKLLSSFLKLDTMDVTNYEIVFVCGDGYRPTMKLEKLLRGAPFLAFQDVDAKEGNWIDLPKVKFAPFYIVWTDVTFDDHSWSMPYGLVKIEVKKSEDKLLPKDPNMMAGFALFRDKCNRCHQINGIGGDMGTELNYPKSVTEYWKEADLKAFIKHPTSYRQNAKMPEMDVNDAQIDTIVQYLGYMSQHKGL